MKRHRACLVCRSPRLRPMEDFVRVELVECSECGLVFTPRIPTHEELVEHYEGYTRDTSVNSPVSMERREEILDGFEAYRQNNRILDVGCGVGFMLDQARARGWETHGTEYTDEAVALCSANGHAMAQGPLDASNYEPESFDVVIYTEVIEHINNQPEEFEQVYRLLRPGGLVYVTTPNFDSISRRILGDRWNVIQYPEHLVYFTPTTLKRLFESHGFQTVHFETTGVSISRIRRSFQAARKDRSTPRAKADDASGLEANPVRSGRSGDELLRRVLERGPMPVVKRTLNGLLTATGTGDSLKASFQKPARPPAS